MKYTDEQMREFIRESNAIEDVWDEQSIEDSLDGWRWLSEEVDSLTIMDTLIVHKAVLKKLDPTIAGKLRAELKRDVQIGGRMCPRYYEVPNRLANWIVCVNMNRLPKWDDQSIKGMHVGFERIHPFCDGNGRVGRLIYCWMRQKMKLPIHIIYEKNKLDYYAWFN
jgi:hypothetical protein